MKINTMTFKAFGRKDGSWTNYGVTIIGAGNDYYLCDKDSKHYGEWRDFGVTDVSGFHSYEEAKKKAAEWRAIAKKVV